MTIEGPASLGTRIGSSWPSSSAAAGISGPSTAFSSGLGRAVGDAESAAFGWACRTAPRGRLLRWSGRWRSARPLRRLIDLPASAMERGHAARDRVGRRKCDEGGSAASDETNWPERHSTPLSIDHTPAATAGPPKARQATFRNGELGSQPSTTYRSSGARFRRIGPSEPHRTMSSSRAPYRPSM